MAFNIVDLVKSGISDQTLGQIGNAVGMDGTQTSVAMSGALPGLLGGLAGVAERPGGAESLLDGMRHADDGLLGNAGSMLGDGQGSQLAERGGSLLSSLLGGDADGQACRRAGLLHRAGRKSKGGSLLGMLAPIVVGALRNKVSGDGLDAGGLRSMMSSQRANIDAAMPQGFADSLRSEGFFDSLSGAAPAVASAPASPAPAPAPATPPPAPAASDTTSSPTQVHVAPQPADTSGKRVAGCPSGCCPLAAVGGAGRARPRPAGRRRRGGRGRGGRDGLRRRSRHRGGQRHGGRRRRGLRRVGRGHGGRLGGAARRGIDGRAHRSGRTRSSARPPAPCRT